MPVSVPLMEKTRPPATTVRPPPGALHSFVPVVAENAVRTPPRPASVPPPKTTPLVTATLLATNGALIGSLQSRAPSVRRKAVRFVLPPVM